MSVVKAHTIHCDLPPSEHPQTQHGGTCTGWEPATGQALDLITARQAAVAAGWRRIDGKDYCPAAQRVVEP